MIVDRVRGELMLALDTIAQLPIVFEGGEEIVRMGAEIISELQRNNLAAVCRGSGVHRTFLSSVHNARGL